MDIISVIEEAAKPGMSVVFLIRYPVDPSAWLRDHWVTTEASRDAVLTGKKLMERYSWEGQRVLAEEIVGPWRYALEKIGVKVSVDVYTGSLSSAVENYKREGQISLIIRAENELPVTRFLHRPGAFFGLFKKASLRPILSLRSDH
jgi:hypothetical protein